MNKQRLMERKNDFESAVKRLGEACEQPLNSFIRDSVIQRFEFCWELGWKMLKLRLEELGVDVLNPRDTFKEALQKGLIHDGVQWTEAQRYRNLTTHTYDEAIANEVYVYIIEKGLALFEALQKDLQSW